jgi:hypothetical protein
MNDDKIKFEIIENIIGKNFENHFAQSLSQSSLFIDQLLIELAKNEDNKDKIAKDLINLKSFLDNVLNEYRVKTSFISTVENKKKELEELKNHENQKEL